MKYSLGIDFGTGSGRVLVVNIDTGHIASMSVVKYKNGTIANQLYHQPIPSTFALQNASDYMDVLKFGIPDALQKAGINSDQIVGLGVDFTSSTVVVTDENFDPLSEQDKFKHHPHAYVKLWKHHGAAKEADHIYSVAKQHDEKWLANYGLNVSSEWMIPKVMELVNDAPDILNETAYIMEAGDWIVSKLVNENVRSNCGRGFKTFWNEEDGFYDDFYEKIDPQLPTVIKEKLEGRLVKIGEKAGNLSQEMSKLIGLPAGLPISTAIIDAHSALLGVGSEKQNEFTMVMGTSTCHLMLHQEQKEVKGISGSVKDAIIPGLYAYEAGQSAVGDLFEHAVNLVPAKYEEEAAQRGVSVHQLLEEKAAHKRVGESGLVALDWHNGNRSLLSNSHLRGMIIGKTLYTKIEDIYRAYMEATAFGTKMIMNSYEDSGLEVDTVFACGGLPQKNALLMQIYADILNKPVHVSATDYASGIGAAILGAVAGQAHPTIEKAVDQMKQPFLKTVEPIKENVETYKELFSIYKEIHDHYGIHQQQTMMKLHDLAHRE